jgi:hypothetical protein
MFVFDIETLGKQSSAVILSIGCVYFDPVKKTSFEEMKNTAFFVKFNAEEQIKRHKRTTTRSSLDWWAKQCLNARIKSFIPSNQDVEIEFGLGKFREWKNQYDNGKCFVWARGNLDQLVLDAYEEQLDIEPIFYYNRWRDVRTAIDLWFDTSSGYCNVDYEGFNVDLMITKHNPVDDCLYDAMMLMYGKKS